MLQKSTELQTLEDPGYKVVLDRLSICFSDKNQSNVSDTCAMLFGYANTQEIPTLKVTKNARYNACAVFKVPFGEADAAKHPVCFEAGPTVPGAASYRLDFNPAKLTSKGIDELMAFLNSIVDAPPLEFFQCGRVTRIDVAIDLHGITLENLIVRTSRKQKHGVYSNRFGIPETVYLGTPKSTRIVAYSKGISGELLAGTRLECRLKPKCLGAEIANLPNPFGKIQLIPVAAVSKAGIGIPEPFLSDCIRVRGLRPVLKLLAPQQRKTLESMLAKYPSMLPDMNDTWSSWPDVLIGCGLGKELGATSLDHAKKYPASCKTP